MLDHPGLATLVAAHAKPPNYMFFFEFYEQLNLAEKIHAEEWSPGIDQVLRITVGLGKECHHLEFFLNSFFHYMAIGLIIFHFSKLFNLY